MVLTLYGTSTTSTQHACSMLGPNHPPIYTFNPIDYGNIADDKVQMAIPSKSSLLLYILEDHQEHHDKLTQSFRNVAMGYCAFSWFEADQVGCTLGFGCL